MEIENSIFKQQIKDDIALIQDKVSWDTRARKEEYAFNYWILTKIYNLDESVAHSNITEGNDKGIDCFVHYKDSKELYIIQNKYYAEDNKLSSKEVADILKRPESYLKKGLYKKSPELQEVYKAAKENSDYKVFLHFYVTNDIKVDDIEVMVDNFNDEHDTIAQVFYLNDIKGKYYGKSYDNKISLDSKLSLKVSKSALSIRPRDYGLRNMNKAFYVMAKIREIYDLFCQAEEKGYPLFEENIREYLGTSGINKEIIRTLRNPEERHKFFYYNNGITIICRNADADSFRVKFTDPQIVNGCQTVNSIAHVLKSKQYNDEEFDDVYVMAKILVIEKSPEDNNFYRDIVRYTNSQNSITDSVFAAVHNPFLKIKQEMLERGFLLCVKQSDRYTFSEKYKDNEKKGKLLEISNKEIGDFYDREVKKVTEVQINLEHLIQIIGAFKESAYYAYTKKPALLKVGNVEYYEKFSLRINDFYTVKQMVKLIMLYKKSEHDKKKSDDGRTPISYYLLNFLGFYLEEEGITRYNFLDKVTAEQLKSVYKQFKNLSRTYQKEYFDKHGRDYNQMVKEPVDENIMKSVLNSYFQNVEEMQEYKEFRKIILSFKD